MPNGYWVTTCRSIKDLSCLAQGEPDCLLAVNPRLVPLQRTKCLSSHRPIAEIHCIIRERQCRLRVISCRGAVKL
jgi:hypothetical protein